MLSISKGLKTQISLVLWGVVGLLAVLFLRKQFLILRSNAAAGNISGTNGIIKQKAAQYAVLFDNAFRAWGDAYWVSHWIGDGTDEQACYDIAKQMQANNVTFADVSEAYRLQFRRDLQTDLSSELTSSELTKFFGYL